MPLPNAHQFSYCLYDSSDTNECEHHEMFECDQRCVNTIGSFFCACYQGYRVPPNGTNCEGEGTLFFLSQPLGRISDLE